MPEQLADIQPQDATFAELALKRVDNPTDPTREVRFVQPQPNPFNFDIGDRNYRALLVFESQVPLGAIAGYQLHQGKYDKRNQNQRENGQRRPDCGEP